MCFHAHCGFQHCDTRDVTAGAANSETVFHFGFNPTSTEIYGLAFSVSGLAVYTGLGEITLAFLAALHTRSPAHTGLDTDLIAPSGRATLK